MKSIKYNEIKGDGIFINLDIEYIPYQKLIYEPEKYLQKNKKYYFYCNHGFKSKTVTEALDKLGYNVYQVKK